MDAFSQNHYVLKFSSTSVAHQLKSKIFVVTTIGLALWGAYLSLATGTIPTKLVDVYHAVIGYAPNDPLHFAILQLRIPRLFMAFLVGAALALSGYLMQILVNNPLADPYILGTSGGAALGVNLGLAGLLPLWIGSFYIPPLYAVVGAAGITSAVFFMAKSRSGLHAAKLLLSGVFLSMLTTALVGLFVFMAIKQGMTATVLFWTMGSLEKTSWTGLAWLSAVLLPSIGLFSMYHHRFILLMLGDEKTRNFGIEPAQLRTWLLFGAAMLTGLTVAFCGAIGFIGLVIPHVVRQFCGVTNSRNILYCVVLGGAFLTWSDVLARTLYPPAGLPVGIVTALVGIPFFLYLLAKNAKTFS